jgi:hypothetical protein
MDRDIYNWFVSWRGFILVVIFHILPAFILGLMLFKSYVPVEALRLKTLEVLF